MLNGNQLQQLLDGTLVTIQVFVLAALLGTVLSLVFGVMGLSENPIPRWVSRVYVEVARGVSAIVLLFWVAFALPIFLGFRLFSPLVAGVLALGISMGGYGAEVVRGGIQSIGRGQSEAGISLSLTAGQRLRHVILPQAVVTMLPPYGNLNIEVLKGTALVSLIALSDLTFEAQKLRTNRVILENPSTTASIFATALLIYFILSQLTAVFFRWAETRAGGRWHAVRT